MVSTDSSLTRISAICSFLSPLCVFVAIPIAVAADIPPGRIDFGNANTLQRLVTAMPSALWLAHLSLIGPTIALGTGIGWYQVLRTVGSYVAFGVVLWYLGMVLIVTQDAVEVAIVDYLPAAYVAADASLRPSLLALGAGTSRSLDMVAAVGDSLSFLGLALINVALWRYRPTLRPLAGLGFVSVFLILGGLSLPSVSSGLQGLARLFPAGFMLFMLWMVGMGIVLLRWKPAAKEAPVGSVETLSR